MGEGGRFAFTTARFGLPGSLRSQRLQRRSSADDQSRPFQANQLLLLSSLGRRVTVSRDEPRAIRLPGLRQGAKGSSLSRLEQSLIFLTGDSHFQNSGLES